MVEKLVDEKLRRFITKNSEVPTHELLLGKQELEGEELKLAVQQIQGRQSIKSKLPSWYQNNNIIYPIHLSLEQCSSEATALYKSDLFSGDKLLDLTGGFGVDTYYLAQNFEQVTYVERCKELVSIAKHNFNALGQKHISLVCSESVDYLSTLNKKFDLIYIDPARRDSGGGKLVSIADCEPNVLSIQDELKKRTKALLVKLSPMLDLSLALKELPQTKAVYIVSVDNECKELLLHIDYDSVALMREPAIHCININKTGKEEFCFTQSKERDTHLIYATKLGRYLYEPNASLLKAGAFNSVAQKEAVLKLHPNSHLYTSDELNEEFPGRRFEVVKTYGFDKKSLRNIKKDMGKANLTIRNFPSTVAQLRKKLKLSEGGEDYLFATTLFDETKVLIKTKKCN